MHKWLCFTIVTAINVTKQYGWDRGTKQLSVLRLLVKYFPFIFSKK
jgi:hypothetical protein